MGIWQLTHCAPALPDLSWWCDACSACHSRRRVIAKDAQPSAPFLNSYAPADLEPGLYHADGQIDGEVFEYGSFVQSRMYHAGVMLGLP